MIGDVVVVAAVGVAAGMLAGLLGVGGGIAFVPALVLLFGLGQVEAEATSLLAIVPVAAVGALRQHAYGNLHLGTGVAIGVFAIGGGAAGVALANVLPVRVLELGFAAIVLVVAAQLAQRALRGSPG